MATVPFFPSRGITTCPPPRFCTCERSHWLARKCFSEASRKARNFPFSRSTPAKKFFGQNPQEELLGQVFSLVRLIAAATDVGIERIPVNAAEFAHRFGRARRGLAAGRPPAPASIAWRQSLRHRNVRVWMLASA